MCGRFTLTASTNAIADYFEINADFEHIPRYNIAPSQPILIIRENENHQKSAVYVRWGFIPHWMKEEDISSQWINARAETVSDKTLFKESFKHRRCLIITDGFFEWQANKIKQPYYIYKKNHQLMAFAGLWEKWESKEGKIIESCTILTIDANSILKPIHHRMPVILFKTQFDTWLNTKNQSIEKLNLLLRPYSATDLEYNPVSTFVNSPLHEGQACIQPFDEIDEK